MDTQLKKNPINYTCIIQYHYVEDYEILYRLPEINTYYCKITVGCGGLIVFCFIFLRVRLIFAPNTINIRNKINNKVHFIPLKQIYITSDKNKINIISYSTFMR